MPRVALTVFVLGLSIFAFIDCLQTPTPRILSKPLWLVIIVIAPVLGPLLWLLLGRTHPGGWGRWDEQPLGPDDDPSFLRDLNLK
mgnify:CR=1 FL=1